MLLLFEAATLILDEKRKIKVVNWIFFNSVIDKMNILFRILHTDGATL